MSKRVAEDDDVEQRIKKSCIEAVEIEPFNRIDYKDLRLARFELVLKKIYKGDVYDIGSFGNLIMENGNVIDTSKELVAFQEIEGGRITTKTKTSDGWKNTYDEVIFFGKLEKKVRDKFKSYSLDIGGRCNTSEFQPIVYMTSFKNAGAFDIHDLKDEIGGSTSKNRPDKFDSLVFPESNNMYALVKGKPSKINEYGNLSLYQSEVYIGFDEMMTEFPNPDVLEYMNGKKVWHSGLSKLVNVSDDYDDCTLEVEKKMLVPKQ